MNIRLLHNRQIDYVRWDRSVLNSHNGLVFAFSWYLNTVCVDWHALVMDDYQAILPLPVVCNWYVCSILQPPFIPVLGVMWQGHKGIRNIEEDFLNFLWRKYLNVDLCLVRSKKQPVSRWQPEVITFQKIDLIRPFTKIQVNFEHGLKTELYNARKSGYTAMRGVQPAEYLSLTSGGQGGANMVRRLMISSLRFNLGEVIGVYNSANVMCGAGLFVWSHNRCFLLSVESDPMVGDEFIAKLVINRFLEDYAEKNLTLYSINPKGVLPNDLLKKFGANDFEYYRFLKKSVLQKILRI